MTIRVRLFAGLREAAGEDAVPLELPSTSTVEAAWSRLVERHPLLAPRRRSLSAAVNRRYVGFDEPLVEGDEVVFVPPVSGG